MKKLSVNSRIPEATWDKLREVADAQRRPMSEVMTTALELYFSKLESTAENK